MKQLLHINASPRGSASRSLKIANAFLESCLEQRPETKVDTLHLFEEPLPPCTDVPTAKNRALFERFAEADYYLFNIPMWNMGVPYVVKQFVDNVNQPGQTFRLSSRGYVGLMRDKRACVIYTSDVFYPNCPPQWGLDFQTTYFTHWLNIIGIKDVEEIRIGGEHHSSQTGDLKQACALAADLGRRL